MFREIILPIFRSTRLCVIVCGIKHRRRYDIVSKNGCEHFIHFHYIFLEFPANQPLENHGSHICTSMKTCWEARQRGMAAKLTRLAQKVLILQYIRWYLPFMVPTMTLGFGICLHIWEWHWWIENLCMTKLKRDYIQGIPAAVWSRIFCLPGSCLVIWRLKYTDNFACCVWVKLCLSH